MKHFVHTTVSSRACGKSTAHARIKSESNTKREVPFLCLPRVSAASILYAKLIDLVLTYDRILQHLLICRKNAASTHERRDKYGSIVDEIPQISTLQLNRRMRREATHGARNREYTGIFGSIAAKHPQLLRVLEAQTQVLAPPQFSP